MVFDTNGGERLNISSAGVVTQVETGTGNGQGGIKASTASGGGNAGFGFITAGTQRFNVTTIGSAGSEALRVYDNNNSVERLRITSSGALGTNSTVRSANGGLDLQSQGATNLGTLTLGASGGQNGQSRNANTENQFRIMMPTYANPANMTTVMYGTSGTAGHDLFYGGGTGWALSLIHISEPTRPERIADGGVVVKKK